MTDANKNVALKRVVGLEEKLEKMSWTEHNDIQIKWNCANAQTRKQWCQSRRNSKKRLEKACVSFRDYREKFHCMLGKKKSEECDVQEGWKSYCRAASGRTVVQLGNANTSLEKKESRKPAKQVGLPIQKRREYREWDRVGFIEYEQTNLLTPYVWWRFRIQRRSALLIKSNSPSCNRKKFGWFQKQKRAVQNEAHTCKTTCTKATFKKTSSKSKNPFSELGPRVKTVSWLTLRIP